jgi:hypothetical protein
MSGQHVLFWHYLFVSLLRLLCCTREEKHLYEKLPIGFIYPPPHPRLSNTTTSPGGVYSKEGGADTHHQHPALKAQPALPHSQTTLFVESAVPVYASCASFHHF